jgi:hypothetical protein
MSTFLRFPDEQGADDKVALAMMMGYHKPL